MRLLLKSPRTKWLSSLFLSPAVEKWCQAARRSWITQTRTETERSVSGVDTSSWVTWTNLRKRQKLWTRTAGFTPEIWGDTTPKTFSTSQDASKVSSSSKSKLFWCKKLKNWDEKVFKISPERSRLWDIKSNFKMISQRFELKGQFFWYNLNTLKYQSQNFGPKLKILSLKGWFFDKKSTITDN